MNILDIVSRAMYGIYPNDDILIIKEKAVETDGIFQYEKKTLKVTACIQPASNDVISKDTYLQGVESNIFYIFGLNAEIINFFRNAKSSNTIILYKNLKYTAYSIDNWQNGGFIKIIATLNGAVKEEETTGINGIKATDGSYFKSENKIFKEKGDI